LVLLPIDVVAYVLAALTVILLVGGLFVRLGQPRVVGEMISGILVGPTVLADRRRLGGTGVRAGAGAR
jgi:Kef-type K+ transport system membrane component KefB